jgi:hypothetical protein
MIHISLTAPKYFMAGDEVIISNVSNVFPSAASATSPFLRGRTDLKGIPLEGPSADKFGSMAYFDSSRSQMYLRVLQHSTPFGFVGISFAATNAATPATVQKRLSASICQKPAGGNCQTNNLTHELTRALTL